MQAAISVLEQNPGEDKPQARNLLWSPAAPSWPGVIRSQQTAGKAVKRAFFPRNAAQVIGLLLTNDMAAPKINCQRILLTDFVNMGSVHA